jgi:hypothetical protein
MSYSQKQIFTKCHLWGLSVAGKSSQILSQGLELVSQGIELVSQGIELVSQGLELEKNITMSFPSHRTNPIAGMHFFF